jgi:hypothetical protein
MLKSLRNRKIFNKFCTSKKPMIMRFYEKTTVFHNCGKLKLRHGGFFVENCLKIPWKTDPKCGKTGIFMRNCEMWKKYMHLTEDENLRTWL